MAPFAPLLFALQVSGTAAVPVTQPAETLQHPQYDAGISTPAAPTAITETAPTRRERLREALQDRAPWAPPPWELQVAAQAWARRGQGGIGFNAGDHDLRALVYSPGIYLDYRYTLTRVRRVRVTAGTLLGYPLQTGLHVGAQYRTGGDSLLGRLSIGVEGGVHCPLDAAPRACFPSAGAGVGVHFTPGDVGF